MTIRWGGLPRETHALMTGGGAKTLMSLRSIFGANLTRLTEKRGTVNRVARQIGIDRRQFRRYLAGEIIPHGSRLTAIAQYFGVGEEAFFTEDEPQAARDTMCADALQRARSGPPSLEPGLYQTWFWTPEHRNTVVGAVTAIRRDSDGLSFRRLTASAEKRGSTFSYVRGDHHGVISQRLNWIYFQGTNQIEPKEPTLLSLNRAISSRLMLNGHGMVMTQGGPTFVTVVMIPADPATTLRAALRLARAIPIEDPLIGLQVAGLLRRPVAGWI